MVLGETKKGRLQLDSDHDAPALRPYDGAPVVVKGTETPLSGLVTELLVCAVSKSKDEEWSLPSELEKYDNQCLGGALGDMVVDNAFSAAEGSKTEVLRVANATVKRVVLFGTDDPSKAAAYAVEKGRGIKAASSVTLWIDSCYETVDMACVAQEANVAAFVDERFKGTKSAEKEKAKKTPPNQLVVVGHSIDPEDVKRGEAIARGIVAVKEMVAAPANNLTPERLGDAAEMIAEEVGLDITILEREDCLERGMGCYMSVTQGSLREPKFIHMIYRPEGCEVKRSVALVGKAITHDTGGYNIKTGSSIAQMKTDMAGAAAVLGTALAIGRIKPPNVMVHFLMPACENMVSEKATHPGDVVTAANGKTVEIMNTDAEGRLCLADALVYAEEQDVNAIVDIATLTGSIGAALGPDVAGYFTKSDDIARRVEVGGEQCWRMPLVNSYKDKLKSRCSDLRNISTIRQGGAITAALFLQEFVKMDEYVHIDIANVATAEGKGPTGWGVQTLLGFVESYVEE